MWVATGDGVEGLDLHTRKPIGTLEVPGASAVAFDPGSLQLYIGTETGELWVLDTTIADELRTGAGGVDTPILEAAQVATLDGAIQGLAVFDDGTSIAARLGEDTVTVVDPGTGEERGSVQVEGLGEMTAAGTGDAVVASPALIPDPEAAAAVLAEVFGGDAAGFLEQLASDPDRVTLDAGIDDTTRAALETAISDGRIEGVTIEPVGQLAVAGADGVLFLGPSGGVTSTVPVPGGATSVVLVTGVHDGTQVYATTPGENGEPGVAIINVSGDNAKDGPNLKDTSPLPGAGERILYDEASELVQVLGTRPDGAGKTMYVARAAQRAAGDLRRPRAAVRPVGLGARPQRRLPDRQPRARSSPSARRARPPPSTSATTTSRGACRACSSARSPSASCSSSPGCCSPGGRSASSSACSSCSTGCSSSRAGSR